MTNLTYLPYILCACVCMYIGVGGILEGKQHTCINSTIGMKNEVLIHLKWRAFLWYSAWSSLDVCICVCGEWLSFGEVEKWLLWLVEWHVKSEKASCTLKVSLSRNFCIFRSKGNKFMMFQRCLQPGSCQKDDVQTTFNCVFQCSYTCTYTKWEFS